MINPYKKLSKVNPQREDGRREVANDVWKALIRAKLRGSEYQTILFVLDKSWGFSKNSDGIAYSQIKKASKLSRPAIINSVKGLELKRILVVDRKVVKGSLPVNEYLFNKHYDTWLNETGKVMFTSLDVDEFLLSVKKKRKRREKVVKGSLPVEIETGKDLKQTGKENENKLVKQPLPTKERRSKESTTKESIYTLFEFWNSLEIIQHEKIDKFKSTLKAALKNYSIEKIKNAMINYNTVLKGEKYYWSHSYKLDNFLKMPGNIDRFLDINEPLKNFLKEKANGRTNKRNTRDGWEESEKYKKAYS